MIRILGCLTQEHAPLGVLAAAAVCVTAALACALLLRGTARTRAALAALAIGAGAWATHFVALLAYDVGVPAAFSVGPTLLSVAVALLGSLGALALWCRGGPGWRAAGGAALGLTIAAMHYLGMSALLLAGHRSFQPDLVAASVVAATGLGAAALWVLRATATLGRRLAGALLLVLTIVSLHFTGMGAIEFWPDPAVEVPAAAVPRLVLGALVTAVVAGALVAGLAGLALEARLNLSAQAAESSRMRSLADAAFEALALLDPNGIVVDGSSRLAELAETPRDVLIGRPFDALLRAGSTDDAATLTSGVPVELRRRLIETASGPRTVVSIRDLRERIESERRIRHLAWHDTLTGLANRARLLQSMEEERARAGRGGESFAVLCLDLDRFKPVNDLYGHAAGDRLLQQVAERLQESVRRNDLCARMGGDEFVIVQSMAGQPAAAQALAERLLVALSRPFDLGDGIEAGISASIGIALHPTDGDGADDLLRAADMALYRVKEGGRCGFAFFKAEMDEELRQRRELEAELRLAASHGQLSLAWQPQAESGTGEVTGFEVLLRWNHPQRGPIRPDVFIPLAESSGCIVSIGTWVLRAATAEAASWARPLRVAVNVSPIQVQQADFAETVRRVLEETGLDPRRLELEVTESLLIEDADQVLATLRALKDLGVVISLDDFGTGYSSLAMLRMFPFDKMKMDRSFVGTLTQDPESEALVRAILGLSRGLRLPVVAEGVETEAQAAILREARCESFQGYLIGRPQPIAVFDEVVGRTARQAA